MINLSIAAIVFLIGITALMQMDRWFWVFELLTHFSLQWMVGAGLCAVLFAIIRSWKWMAVAVVVFVFHAGAVLSVYSPPPAPKVVGHDELTIAHANVLILNQNHDEIAQWVRDPVNGFDVVSLQEVSPALSGRLKQLQEYPYQYHYPERHAFGAAILSKYELSDMKRSFLANNSYISATLSLEGDKALRIYALHTNPPVSPEWLVTRNQQVIETARAVAADESDYKIMIGDYNLTPYSYWFKELLRISGLQDSRRGQGIQGSWPAMFPTPLFKIPIDHVLTSPDVVVKDRRLGPPMGSDHLPVIVDVAL